MDSGHGRMRMNLEDDRLSSLPDELIHKIISSFDIKHVIKTSSLSSRWRYIWTSMPYLNFSSNKGFSTLPKFANFVTNVLSHRNNHAGVYSLNICYHGKMAPAIVKRILTYAFSHNIQRLNMVHSSVNLIAFPLSLLTSQSLKQLSLTSPMNRCIYGGNCLTSTWELPALTTLDLHMVTLRCGNAHEGINVFSKCANLKNLMLKYFKTEGSNGFSIVHPQLSNLTLDNTYFFGQKAVNVAAPQLKTLTIKECPAELVISAPNLASLRYKGDQLNLSTDGFQSLEMADICVTGPKDANAPQIVSLLQVLHNVNFLTLNVALVEFLSSSAGPILHQLSPFDNLKCLKINPDESYFYGEAMKKETMCAELRSYLLDISSGCTFTIILPEEVIAQKLMAELRELLLKEKDNTMRENAWMKIYESKTEMMVQLESCWGNLVVQIEQNKKNACHIMSKLQYIEELVVMLPASRRAKIQPCFHSLRADAGYSISKITDCIMTSCEEIQNRSNVLLRELTTELVEPSA